MHFLDKTPLLSYMKTWLESEDVDLMTTSVLALGNFARTDDHCTRMVQDNMHIKLIEILSKNNGPEADVRLQHALVRRRVPSFDQKFQRFSNSSSAQSEI